MENLVPYNTPLKKVRIGGKGDGGYVVVDNGLCEYDTLIAMGICDNNQFEVEFNKLSNAYVQQYDYSIDSPPEHIENSDFFKVKVESASDIVKHSGSKKFLKIDIEGSEWDLLPTMNLDEYEQILIELHIYNKQYDVFDNAIKHLTKNHKIVHVHANNNGQPFVYIKSNGKLSILINLLELTLLRSDLTEFSKNTTSYPTELDSPNVPSRPDWDLDFYPFAP